MNACTLALLAAALPRGAEPQLNTYRTVEGAIPLTQVLDALQKEASVGALCVATAAPAEHAHAAQVLRAGLERALAGQRGLTHTTLLDGDSIEPGAATKLAEAAGCALVLHAQVLVMFGSAPQVIFTLMDLDGDQLAVVASNAALTTVVAGAVQPVGPISDMKLRAPADRDKIAMMYRQGVKLLGDDNWENQRPVIIRWSGTRLTAAEVRQATDNPNLHARLEFYEDELGAYKTTKRRGLLWGLLAPAVTLPVGMLLGVVVVSAVAFSMAGGSLLFAGAVQLAGTVMAVAALFGVLVGSVAGALMALPAGAVGAMLGYVVASAVNPSPAEPLTIEEARTLVVEYNMRRAAELELPVEDIPGVFLPLPRPTPQQIIPERLAQLQRALSGEEAQDEEDEEDGRRPPPRGAYQGGDQ